MAVGQYGFALLHFAQALLLERDQPQALANLDLLSAEIGRLPSRIPFITDDPYPPFPLEKMQICDPNYCLDSNVVSIWPPFREHGFPIKI